MFVACPHSSYAVTVLRGYDKEVAAIKGAGVAAIKEVDAAAGGRGRPREPRALRERWGQNSTI